MLATHMICEVIFAAEASGATVGSAGAIPARPPKSLWTVQLWRSSSPLELKPRAMSHPLIVHR